MPIKHILFNKRMFPSCYWPMFIKHMHLIRRVRTRPHPHLVIVNDRSVARWLQCLLLSQVMKNIEERAIPMIEPPFSRQTV